MPDYSNELLNYNWFISQILNGGPYNIAYITYLTDNLDDNTIVTRSPEEMQTNLLAGRGWLDYLQNHSFDGYSELTKVKLPNPDKLKEEAKISGMTAKILPPYKDPKQNYLGDFVKRVKNMPGNVNEFLKKNPETWNALGNTLGTGLSLASLAMYGNVEKPTWLSATLETLTNLNGLLPPLFLWAAPMINGITNFAGGAFASTSKSMYRDNKLESEIGGYYSGSIKDLNKASENAGVKSAFGIGTGKRNRIVNKGLRTMADMLDIRDKFYVEPDAYTSGLNYERYNYKTNEFNYNLLAIVRNGGILAKKIASLSKVNSLLSSRKQGGTLSTSIKPAIADSYVKPIFSSDIEFFKEGGKVNVIPEGALHARLNNMEIDNITKKGIPVVALSEGGLIELQAEIERSEIIYRLEVTKKLEELSKIYYSDDSSQKEKDEAALEAGKLLVQETLYNTIDNTLTLI